MEKKEYQGKLYNYAATTEICPQITIEGKPYCVLKDCYFRAIGAACPPEAPLDWQKRADLIIEKWDRKPEEWI